MLLLGGKIDRTEFVKADDRTIFGRNVQFVIRTYEFLDGIVEDILLEKEILPTLIEIGDNVFIADSCFLPPEVLSISKDAIIGNEAPLTKNIGPEETQVGNPFARIGIRYDERRNRSRACIRTTPFSPRACAS